MANPWDIHKSLDAALEVINCTDPNMALMLGNGFGCSYDYQKFDWTQICTETLLRYRQRMQLHYVDVDSLLNIRLKSPNVEDALAWLEHSMWTLELMGHGQANNVRSGLNDSRIALEKAFIEAIAHLQPNTGKAIHDDDKAACCRAFARFTTLFTVNYDLLLYWVFLYDNQTAKRWFDCLSFQNTFADGNGLSVDANSWVHPNNNQNVFYLHGAVHLFRPGDGLLRKLTYSNNTNILTRAASLMHSPGAMHPEFIAGGDASSKLWRIKGKDYLEFCQKQLETVPTTMVTFGWGLQDRDNHLIDKLISGSCQSLIVGVQGNDHAASIKAMETYSRVRRLEIAKKAPSLNVAFYNSDSFPLWDPANPHFCKRR